MRDWVIFLIFLCVFDTFIQLMEVLYSQTEMQEKQDLQIKQIKKKFSTITADLQYQYKSNILAYKTQYQNLVHILNDLYRVVKKCQQSIIPDQQHRSTLNPHEAGVNDCNHEIYNCHDNDHDDDDEHEDEHEDENQNENQQNQNQQGNQENGSSGQNVDDLDQEYEPVYILQFFRQFSINAAEFCHKLRGREFEVKKEINQLFSVDANYHFLEALAKKNLENFDLSLKVEQLNKTLDFKVHELQVAQKTTKQYQRKFQAYEKDFNAVVLSMCDMLKDCERTEIQLRQESRLQGEVFQSHKIEFQRFKADFKYKPSLEQKATRVRQVLEKKFQDREILLLKQAEKRIQNKYKHKLP